ncbi:hypothetical protein [Streptomyces sp. NPDC060027]|uniref:hypothetical protein n=1 Tax=Streptomyces sp. NPDC060027 TaxID=3347040 RepID=UPI0036CFB3CE
MVRQAQGERHARRALADLALAGLGQSGTASTTVAPRQSHRVPVAGVVPSGEGGAVAGGFAGGSVPGADAGGAGGGQAVGQAMAVQGAACVFGDPGRGKTAAVRLALHDVPAGWKVTWAAVPVRPSVTGMRRALFDDDAEPIEGRTTDPATWMRTPEPLNRLAAFTREAAVRRRAIAGREQNASVTDPGSQQHQQSGPEHGPGPGPGQRP